MTAQQIADGGTVVGGDDQTSFGGGYGDGQGDGRGGGYGDGNGNGWANGNGNGNGKPLGWRPRGEVEW